jgi:uncharacterized protein (TIGR03435 family)
MGRIFLQGRVGCWGLLLLAVAAPGMMLAQAAAPLAFEVSTVKPSDPNKQGGMLMISEHDFQTEGQTLKAMIKFVYGLNFGGDQLISGGPSWAGSAKFDIFAKEDEATSAALKKLPNEQRTSQLQLMVRELLAERFKLKVHTEKKELPVYAMTVAKGGPKMTVFVPPAAGAPPPPPGQGWSGIKRTGPGQMEGRNLELQMLGNVLGMQPEIGGRMVVDKTGLTGKYSFLLKWTPDAGMSAGDAGAPVDASGPSLFTALQEELGLKLEPAKAPEDTIVIDSAEMPTEN